MRAVFIAFFFSLLCGRAGAHFTGPRLVGENARTFTQATKRDDARTFKDQRLGLTEETHTEGLWTGWTVLFVPDLKGRVGVVKIVGPNNTPAKEFTLGYDEASRLSGSSTPELPASYGARDARGNLTTLTRGGLVTEWGYHEAVDKVGLLSGVSNKNNLGNDSFAYTYPSYNQQRQITHRHATRGVSWAGLSYDGSQELASAVMTPGRRLDYGYNTRGTRTGQGAEAALAVNLLDQVTRRTLQNRGFGLIGSVDPRATVRVSTPVLPGWQKMEVDAVNGGFSGWWKVPANFIMAQRGLRAIQSKNFFPKTSDGRADRPSPNLLSGQPFPVAPNRAWAGDIPFIPTSAGWLYLAVVIDLCSRRIVGWSLADHMRSQLVVDALSQALQSRLSKGTIFHSDRGSQYGSAAFRSLLNKAGMGQSMSARANPYDNAWTESFIGTLKLEML